MFGETKKQAIIVYRKKEEKHAHLLASLISAYTDYKVAEWEEKHWDANKATLPSSQKIIFFGDSDTAHKHTLGISWRFNEHFMKYGWLGDKCIVDVDVLPAGMEESFLEHYRNNYKKFENIANEYKESDLQKRPAAVAETSAFILFGLPAVAVSVVGKRIFGNRKLVDYQYELLVREFVFNGLSQFMED